MGTAQAKRIDHSKAASHCYLILLVFNVIQDTATLGIMQTQLKKFTRAGDLQQRELLAVKRALAVIVEKMLFCFD